MSHKTGVLLAAQRHGGAFFCLFRGWDFRSALGWWAILTIPSFNKDTHAFRQRKSALTASSRRRGLRFMSGRYSYGIGTPPTLRRSASPTRSYDLAGDPAAAYASMPASSSLSSSGFPLAEKSCGVFAREKWRPRKRGAAGRLAPVNATHNVGRYLYPQKPYVLLPSEGRWNTNIPLKPRCFLWGQCILHPENSNSHLLCRFAGGSAKMQNVTTVGWTINRNWRGFFTDLVPIPYNRPIYYA